MSDPPRITTARASIWRAAAWLSAVFPVLAVLALLMPLLVLPAAALVILALTLGYPSNKSLVQTTASVRIAIGWHSLSASSILALPGVVCEK
ncbi:hypothetical protein [Arthrobacter polaris]|uniref:hypothetical protein n=1 Tax=Arthrobacter polaris TaxID=2813727 RepID=UPI001F21C369|nr:hypothetical protein [Arthrobacter polaris]UIK89597.1 hypothetical protein J0916_04085 [Arthrobacter polaris]